MSGYLYLIIGPMFAGKTSTLIRLISKFKSLNTPYLVIKHSIDNRYNNLDCICSHNHETEKCSSTNNLLEYLQLDEYKTSQIIIIEEAQFFGDDLIFFCKQAVDIDKKYLIVTGLSGDYKRETFGKILNLIPLADKIINLKSKCSYCVEDAIFTLKKSDNSSQIEIGHNDIYQPVCRKHYVNNIV
jgi:thymidine kinase